MIIALPVVFEFNDYIARTKIMCGKIHSQYICNAFNDLEVNEDIAWAKFNDDFSEIQTKNNISMTGKNPILYKYTNNIKTLAVHTMPNNLGVQNKTTYIVSVKIPKKTAIM